MKKFIVLAPNGDRVVLTTTKGTYTFKHGEIITDENFNKMYPNIFIPYIEHQPKIEEKVKENIDKIEEKVEEQVIISQEQDIEENNNVIEQEIKKQYKRKK